MARIIILFNLHADSSPEKYESWARSVDIPLVNGLPGVAAFSVYRSTGLLVGEGSPPYAYSEILDVDDMDAFGAALATEKMQEVAAQFQTFADNPVFITTEEL